MTRTELKHISEVISAYAEGKTVEVVMANNKWRTLKGELDIELLTQYPNSYRVKNPTMFELNTWYYSKEIMNDTTIIELFYFIDYEKFSMDTQYGGKRIYFCDYNDFPSLNIYTDTIQWESILKRNNVIRCNNPKEIYESFLRDINKKLFKND